MGSNRLGWIQVAFRRVSNGSGSVQTGLERVRLGLMGEKKKKKSFERPWVWIELRWPPAGCMGSELSGCIGFFQVGNPSITRVFPEEKQYRNGEGLSNMPTASAGAPLALTWKESNATSTKASTSFGFCFLLVFFGFSFLFSLLLFSFFPELPSFFLFSPSFLLWPGWVYKWVLIGWIWLG